MVESAPMGAGYPALRISPYLQSHRLGCWIATDGAAIIDESSPPSYAWWIAGGPALSVDYEPSRTPKEIIDALKSTGLLGQPIGIYRIVARQQLDDLVWNGVLPEPVEATTFCVGECDIVINFVQCSIAEFVGRLTFGAYGNVLDIHLPGPSSNFWVPHVTRNFGFFNAERKNRRFLNYLEILPHITEAAWDERSIFVRVQADLRRDFAHAFVALGNPGGFLSFGDAQFRSRFFDRLAELANRIALFGALLRESSDADESVFHSFLASNSILLDVYSIAISKPRFNYPSGSGPLGKEYVEPDFVLKYQDGSYKLVELERPSKAVATKQGHPRSEFTQASFQIAEWRHFLANHYDVVRGKFPGISNNPGAMLVISRATERSFGTDRDITDYKALLRAHLPSTEVFTYDDLLDRAKFAYAKLLSLSGNI